MQKIKFYGYKIVAKLFPSIIWSKSIDAPNVYFTFDDGPHPKITPQILDILKEYNCLATFFLVGKNLCKYPKVVSRILQEGHTIGLHSYSHKMLLLKSRQQLLYELLQPQKDLQEIIGIRPTIFRPPFGKFTPGVIKLCNQLELTVIMWTIMSYDFDLSVPNQQITTKISRLLKNGDIVVFHDGDDNSARTVKILPEIIEDALHKGKLLTAL